MNIIQTFRLAMDRDLPEFKDFPEMGLSRINIGAGKKSILGFDDLDADRGWSAPDMSEYYGNCSVEGICAFHFLEHLNGRDVILMLKEMERVMAIGAVANILVPHHLGEMAYQDLDHKSFWSEGTFHNLFNNPYYDGTMQRDWKLKVNSQPIIGIVQRNLALLVQLEKF